MSPERKTAGLVLVAVLFGAGAFTLGRGTDLTEGPDFVQNARIAYNLVRYGEFHESADLPELRAAGRLQPYSRRTPGYPLLLAAVFAASPEIESLSHECINDPACAAADPLHRRIRWLTRALKAMMAAGICVATFALTASWPLSVAVGVLGLMLLRLDHAELLAACLLLGHATLAALAWRRPHVAAGLAGGVALGLLALTRAIFQYWLVGVALVCAVGIWRDAARRRALLPACAALVVGSWAIALPWMARNAVQAGHFGVSGRDGEVIAIRAEYGRMTWPELRGAFAYYLPEGPAAGVRSLAMRSLAPDGFGYARFDRDNPEGFYLRSKLYTGAVAARADRSHPDWRRDDQARMDAALRQAAGELIREDWLKHAGLTLVFAERGYGGLFGHGCPAGDGALADLARTLCVPVKGLTSLLLLPALGLLSLLAWKRGDLSVAFLLLPAAWAFGAHAAATHFLPRYAYPLAPVMLVAFALAGNEVGRLRHRIVGTRERETDRQWPSS